MSRRTDEQDGAGSLGRPRWCCDWLHCEDIGEMSREIRIAPPEVPAVGPGFPAIRAPQTRSLPHGKNGRSCSPGYT